MTLQTIRNCVLAIHFMILGYLCLLFLFEKPHIIRKPIAIRTHQLPAPSIVKQTPKPSFKPVKKAAAKPAQKTAIPQIPSIQTELQLIAKQLENISAPEPALPTICAIEIPKNIDQQAGASSLSYTQAIASFLEHHFVLPEQGEVIADLTIQSNGSISAIEIIKTENEKNSAFLKKHLHQSSFPCFNEFGLKLKELNITITFQNAEFP